MTTKEITVTPRRLENEKSTQEELIERREAIEKDREAKEKPRKDFMLTGKGKASDHFDVTTNRDTVERYTDQTGAPQSTEELSESAREKWLRTGDLPAAKSNGRAKQQAEPQFTKEQLEANGIDWEVWQDIENQGDNWWDTREHQEAARTMTDRTVKAIQALSPEEKAIISASPVQTMQIDPEFDSFLAHATARAKNLGRVHVELCRDPAFVERINADWKNTANNPTARRHVEQSIRHVLAVIDKRAGTANSNGSRGPRKLTQAGRPPIESSGASSSPSDDGSSEAAWKRKDLSTEAKGELYRERKNKEEANARRKKYGRR